jgi:hypothetical protein
MHQSAGSRMPPVNLQPEHHFSRQVSSSRLKRRDDGVVYGCFPQAFLMRENESELSGSWLEYFQGTRLVQMQQTVLAIRAVGLTVRNRDGLTVSNVASFHSTCAEFGVRVRILHEPSRDNPNPAYATVRNLVRDNNELLGLLAAACVEVAEVSSLE